ncbi:MAG: heavy-metal-associated domain-containing protein [Desulfonatronovibrio sp. MSAO_Bac4]|nr:MAG: heavy-metal-associated domain-containing protein [Desulfonatronovibrio sp. MSAO_Bac4]
MTEIKIEGMSCQHCVKAVEQALGELDGISSVKVSLEDKNAVFETDGSASMEQIKQAIADAGYKVVS